MSVAYDPMTAPPTPRWRTLRMIIALDLLGVRRSRVVLVCLLLCTGAVADILLRGEVVWSGGAGIGAVCVMQAVLQSGGASVRVRRLRGLLPVTRGEVVLARWLEAIGLLGGTAVCMGIVGVWFGDFFGPGVWLTIEAIGVAAGVPAFLCLPSGWAWPVWIVAWSLGVVGMIEGVVVAVDALCPGVLGTMGGSNVLLALVCSVTMGLSLAVTHLWYCRQDH